MPWPLQQDTAQQDCHVRIGLFRLFSAAWAARAPNSRVESCQFELTCKHFAVVWFSEVSAIQWRCLNLVSNRMITMTTYGQWRSWPFAKSLRRTTKPYHVTRLFCKPPACNFVTWPPQQPTRHVVYLMALSAWSIWRRMLGRFVVDELEGIWKERI